MLGSSIKSTSIFSKRCRHFIKATIYVSMYLMMTHVRYNWLYSCMYNVTMVTYNVKVENPEYPDGKCQIHDDHDKYKQYDSVQTLFPPSIDTRGLVTTLGKVRSWRSSPHWLTTGSRTQTDDRWSILQRDRNIWIFNNIYSSTFTNWLQAGSHKKAYALNL
mgnify:CR=1 FL=1